MPPIRFDGPAARCRGIPVTNLPDAPMSAAAAGPEPPAPVVLGWIGGVHHHQGQDLWQWATASADAVVHRESLAHWHASPPRLPVTHGLIWQTNRYENSTLGVPSASTEEVPDRQGHRQNEPPTGANRVAGTRWLVVRGPGIPPSVRLPGAAGWVESVDWREAAQWLPKWLGASGGATEPVGPRDPGTPPYIVLADSYLAAEPYLDALPAVLGRDALVLWQREPETLRRSGPAVVLWDDSVAPPCDVANWRQRIGRFQGDGWQREGLPPPAADDAVAPAAVSEPPVHVWITSLAAPQDWLAAQAAGVDAILPKPFRLVDLVGLSGSTAESHAGSKPR